MKALIAMRLRAYTRTQVAVAPLLAAIVILAIYYGGGQAAPAEAFGLSAIILFPVLAWQAKILLDVEPDVQRRIAATAVGSRRREVVAGLIAATLTGLPVILLGLLLPFVLNGVTLEGTTPVKALAAGIWVHLLALPPAVAWGALASRAVSRTAGNGIMMLVGGFVLTIVLGLKDSPVPWLMPPLMPVTRALNNDLDIAGAMLLTGWALAWAAIAVGGYVRLRRNRP